MLSCLRSPRLIFIVGNIPNVSEIAPLLIVIRLEEFDYAGAAGVGLVMLLASFAILLVLNVLQNLLSRRALMYGVLLCTARATGEFGAVAVVSGHIRGETTTMPLHVEILYNEYQSAAAAFAVASLPALFALVTLAVKTLLEAQFADELAAQRNR